MIFNVPGHIEAIRNGTKTQTRRINRGIYKVGKDYAVQSKRGAKGEPDIRIVIDRIWEERYTQYLTNLISEQDAQAEGGYTPIEFEEIFRKLNPKRGGDRWTFEFHVIWLRKYEFDVKRRKDD